MPSTSKHTFENFITGSSNEFAFKAAKAVADDPARVYNPLFIYGNSGLGKTHLLNAISARISKQLPNAVIALVSSNDLTLYMLKAIKAKQTELWYKDLLSVDILLIDDMHVLAGKKATQIEFASMMQALINQGHQVVMTSSIPPEALTWLESRIRKEFRSGLFVDIQPLDSETSKMIAQDKAAKRGLHLSKEAMESISTQFRGEVRCVEGIVTHILAKNDLMSAPKDFETEKGDAEC